MKTIFTKLFASFLIVAGITTVSQSQTINWQWARGAGSTGAEIAEASVLDASGNLYVVGWYTSASINFGTTTLINPGAGTGDMYITKYDAAGTVLWAKTFGGADGEVGNCIAADASGNIYVSGWFTSPNLVMGTFTLANTSVSKPDFFVAKINSAGNTVWAKSAGGAEPDRGYGITLDASGNIFVTGCFGSPSINFGSGALTNAGSATDDFFIVKYDQSGTALWSRSAGGTSADAGLSLATDSLGDVYATGRFMSNAINFGTGSHGNASAANDFFVVKYNSSGTAQWSFSNGGASDDYGDDIMVNKQGIFITGGFTSASVTFGTTTLNNAAPTLGDVLLAKFNYGGIPQWAKKAGGTDMDWGYDVVSDAAGNIYLCGTFASNTIPFGTINVNNVAPGYRDMFIAAYDGSGNPLWATGAGGSFEEAAYGISVNASASDIYVAGFFNSPSVSFGTSTVTKGCGDDVVVAKMTGPAVGIKEQYFSNQLCVYPNPSSGKFTIEADGKVEIYNILGETIVTKNLSGKNQLDLNEYPNGVYLYRVFTTGKNTYSGRIIKE